MHELGIVSYIIKQIEGVATKESLSKVYSVTLDVGEVSAILPDIIQSCWKWSTDKTELLKGSELRCNQITAMTICNSCKKEYETVANGKICPYCKSEDTVLLYGQEVSIKEIEAE